MFYALLAVSLSIACAVSALVVRLFQSPADRIFRRIIQDEIAGAWTAYLKFALFVVGISSGVRIHEIQRYVIAPHYPEGAEVETLTAPKWVLEVYRTVIETLQGLASVLLCFFIVSLVTFVVIRIIEAFRRNHEARPVS